MDLPFLFKYQPQKINDFELNDDIKILINTLITIDKLNILLFGPSGIGKTTLINTIIKEYYNITDTRKLLTNQNILFINNLQEQGIQYYRNEVKNFCQIPSNIPNKKKFIVLDNLDYINEQSQQVFRNCIDKYSHNVHFIGSCFNIQKIIDNLQSRLLVIKLPVFTTENLENIYNRIILNEHINIIDDKKLVKDYLINISNNSIRILINYLEKIKLLGDPLSIKLLKDLCTNISYSFFIEYTNTCKHEKNLNKAIKIFYSLYDEGYSVMDILDNYTLFIKITDILTEDEKYKMMPLVCKYITIFNTIHEEEMELAFLTNNIISLLNNDISNISILPNNYTV